MVGQSSGRQRAGPRDVVSREPGSDAAVGASGGSLAEVSLEALYDEWGGVCYSLALRIVRDRVVAEDVVQDAFTDVWRKRQTFEPSKGRLEPWLLTIVRHKAIDAVRREQRHRAHRTSEPVDGIASDDSHLGHRLHTAHVREDVARLLGSLNSNHQQVLVLSYFEGFSQSEISEDLGIPIGTVKSRSFAALKAFRQALDRAGLSFEDLSGER